MNRSHAITSPSELGAAVRAQRTKLGFSQEMLAAAAGVNPRFVGELERGKPTAQIGKAMLVVQAVGLSLRVDEA